MCVCVCMYVCECVCVRMYVCVHMCVCVRMHVCECVRVTVYPTPIYKTTRDTCYAIRKGSHSIRDHCTHVCVDVLALKVVCFLIVKTNTFSIVGYIMIAQSQVMQTYKPS